MEEQVPKHFWSDLKNLIFALLGLCYFFYLIISDAKEARKKRAHWIPGKAFILSALTIQVLSQLDTMSVSITDNPNIREVAMLLGNHLLIDSGRLIICVFMGYLLPGMARSGAGGDWGDIFALAISLFTGIISELYFLHKSREIFRTLHTTKKVDYGSEYDVVNELQQDPSIKTWYVASSWGIIVSVVFLILFLGSTVTAGNTIRKILSHRIVAALSTKEIYDKSWKGFEEEVFKSWLLAPACRPEYVIGRSVLSSAAGMVVTLRIVFSLLKFKFLKYKDIIQYYDGLDSLREAILLLQCAFVFVAWIAICWRWITAVVYFPRANKRIRVFVVENFWTRHIKEMKYSWESHIADLKEDMQNASFFGKISLWVQVCFFSLAKVCVIGFLWALQVFVVSFSKACWFLSEIVIGNRFVRGCFLESQNFLNYGSEDFQNDLSEFKKHREVLERVRMPEERAASLWVADKKFIKQTKDRIKVGCEKGGDYEELINLVAQRCGSEDYVNGMFVNQPEFESLPLAKEYFPSLDKMCWKMTTLSYLKIMVNIFPTSERVDRAMKAFVQARDFMDFLDSVDIEEDEMSILEIVGIKADQMGKAADQEFKTVQNSVSSRKNNTRIEEPSEEILKMQQEAEKCLKDSGLVEQGTHVEIQDSTDLKKIAPSYSLYRVCKCILHRDGVLQQEKMEDLLDTVIASCVLQFPAKLVRYCREWARDFEEDKIWDRVSLAGKVRGVLEKAQVPPNWTELQLEEQSTSQC
ncbi:hypothetical protein SUGI_0310150 [Cryptomeria japonica]|nr:hypothetical protein SUGI_0310150 [Cryptomeria japonica]